MGVEIYYENVEEHSPAELRELADRLCEESRFGICLDVAHMLLTGESQKNGFVSWLRISGIFISMTII